LRNSPRSFRDDRDFADAALNIRVHLNGRSSVGVIHPVIILVSKALDAHMANSASGCGV
jgi:hypothetical protein